MDASIIQKKNTLTSTIKFPISCLLFIPDCNRNVCVCDGFDINS